MPLLLTYLDEIAQRRLSSTRSAATALEIGEQYIARVLSTGVHW